MATISSYLPAVLFPWEADTITLRRGTSAASVSIEIRFTVAQSQNTILTATLTFNSDGTVTLAGIGDLVLDYFDDTREPGELAIFIDGEAIALTSDGQTYVRVVYCRAKTSLRAAAFVEKYFLTAAQGIKRTQFGQEERINFLTTSEIETTFTASVTALWLLSDDTTEETTYSEDVSAYLSSYGTFIPSAHLTPPDDAATLLEYTASVGNRSMKYICAPYFDAPHFALRFINAFGHSELFHFFADLERENKPTYTAYASNGYTRNFRVDAVPEWTANAGKILDEEIPLFDDLCTALHVYRADTGVEVTVTGTEATTSNSLYEANEVAVTFREAYRRATLMPATAPKTFDATFDETFD